MTDDEQAFIAAIDVNPTDEAPRLVFADWLDEHDRPEEADRQRKWLAAYRHLMPYVRGGHEDYSRDENNESVYKPAKDLTFKEMMSNIDWWLGTASKKDTRYGLTGTIGFGSNWAQDELYDPEKRRLFWDAFYVITGFRASEELQSQESYSCSC